MDAYESQAIDEAVADAIEERHAPDAQVMAAPRMEKYCKRCNGYGRIAKMFFAGIKPCPDCGGTGIALPPEPAWESDLWDAADAAYERAVDRELDG